LTINSFETVAVHTISGPVIGDHRSVELINKSTNVLLVFNFELTLDYSLIKTSMKPWTPKAGVGPETHSHRSICRWNKSIRRIVQIRVKERLYTSTNLANHLIKGPGPLEQHSTSLLVFIVN